VQLLDALFSLFVLAGVEKMRIVTCFTATNAYDLYSVPYTHGLAAALGWSFLVALAARALLGRESGRVALVLDVCVFSRWLLDAPLHTPDIPLLGDASPRIGLDLSRHRELAIAV
jgi:hypothetical protein